MRRKALLSIILSAAMILESVSPAFAAGQIPSDELSVSTEATAPESQDEVVIEDGGDVNSEQESVDTQEVDEEEIRTETEVEDGIEEETPDEESKPETDSAEEEEEKPETLVGAEGARVSVGENVTAGFDSETGTITFYSQGGTLSSEWKSMMNVTFSYSTYDNTIDDHNIKEITISDDSDVMYLPEDCSGLFNEFHQLQSLTLSKADTSNVTDMSSMFSSCTRLQNLDLSSFNTSNVTDMSSMFRDCDSLQTLDLSGFDTSNVTDMSGMFLCCLHLQTLDVSGFDTSKVTDMSCMFMYSSLQTLNVSGFDTSNVTDMSHMFFDCSSLQTLDISGFDTSNVTDMSYMFYGCGNLQTLDLSGFDLIKIENANGMFNACYNVDIISTPINLQKTIDLPCTYFDASGTEYNSLPEGLSESIRLEKKVADILSEGASVGENVTARCDSETGTLTFYSQGGMLSPNWITMGGLSGGSIEGKVIKKITISDDSDVMYLPDDCAELFAYFRYVESIDLSKANTSNVTDMHGMFSDCSSLQTLDVSGFNTSNVTDMSGMFDYCSSLQTLDISGFDTSNVTDMSEMFGVCRSLQSLDVSGFDTSNVTSMSYMFGSCGLQTLDLSGFDTSNVTNMSEMFVGCYNLQTLDVSGFDTSNVTDMSHMFSGCRQLQTLDVSGFDTSNVANMGAMFSGCSGLQTLDLSGFDTSNVTNMSFLFSYSSNLQTLNLNGFDTSNVTNLGGMFRDCNGLQTLDLSGFDTSNVTDMRDMFWECSNLQTLDLSGFDTSNVTDMSWMFFGCGNLQTLDLSGFDTSNVTDMRDMFWECSNLQTLDLSGFDTSNVTDMSWMFFGCGNLQTLDLSGFDTSNVTNMSYMFCDCSSLQTLDLSRFDLSSLQSGTYEPNHTMLEGCGAYIILTPVNSSETVYLPDTFVDASGMEYNSLPQGLSESIRLTKKAAELEILSLSDDFYGKNGTPASFHIEAEGNGTVTYQWQYRTAGTTNWKTPSQASAKTADYGFNLKPSYDNIEVRCIVSDDSGNEIISETRKANVFAFTSQPKDVIASTGEVVNFEVSAIGNNVTYQWYYKRPNSTWKKTTVAGATTAVLPITADTKNDGTSYRCVITDEAGNKINSAAALLTLNDTSLQVTGISEDAYDVNGQSVTFHIDAAGNGDLTYQWQYKLAGETKWRTPSQASAKTADYVFKLRPSYDNIEVRCIVSDASGNSVTSDVRKANVFAITGQPEDAELELGEQTTFAVEAVGKDLAYQWFYMRPEGSWKKVTVAGANTANLVITANTKNDGTKFQCRITDGLGNMLISAAALLTQS